MINTHIFCKVIDNFGDLGVCWRLARQLAHEQQHTVTLWVDDWATVQQMTESPQSSSLSDTNLIFRHWQDDLMMVQAITADSHTVDWLIEGFGCRLPEELLAHIAQQQQPACWVNLEYLSAETWINDCHGLTSDHPRLNMRQHFFFPSVTPKSGGLLREQSLLDQIAGFQHQHIQQRDFWHRYGINPVDFSIKISLFAYAHVPVADLLDQLRDHPTTVLLAMTDSGHRQAVQDWLAAQSLDLPAHHASVRCGSLTVLRLPFLSHTQFDQLLWASDLNLIRGEDSCVRAMWAAQVWLWHIYPQDDDAHQDKLTAMITAMHAVLVGMDDPALQVWQQTLLSYGMSQPTDWQLFLTYQPRIKPLAQRWQQYLGNQTDLVSRLLELSAK